MGTLREWQVVIKVIIEKSRGSGTGIEIWAGFGPVDITEIYTFGPITGNF